MKVCHITSAHSRYDVRIFEKECKSLSKAGYETYLIVNDDAQDELNSNVNIISTGLKCSSRKDRFIYGSKLIFEKALLLNADLYHLHDPDLLGVGFKLKKIGKIVIFDSHEDIPRQILSKKWIPQFARKLVSVLYEKYEKRACTNFNGIITATPYIRTVFEGYMDNVIDIMNYPILLHNEINEDDYFKREQVICYAGGISEDRGITDTIKAIQNINVKYCIAGKIDAKYKEELLAIDSYKKVSWEGLISHNAVNDMYSKSRIGIAMLRETPNHVNSLAIKLFEYMEAGLPIVCSDFKVWKEIVEKNKCGICISPKDIDGINKAVKYLLQNPEVAYEMGKNGKLAVGRYYCWKTEEKKLLKVYSELL